MPKYVKGIPSWYIGDKSKYKFQNPIGNVDTLQGNIDRATNPIQKAMLEYDPIDNIIDKQNAPAPTVDHGSNLTPKLPTAETQKKTKGFWDDFNPPNKQIISKNQVLQNLFESTFDKKSQNNLTPKLPTVKQATVQGPHGNIIDDAITGGLDFLKNHGILTKQINNLEDSAVKTNQQLAQQKALNDIQDEKENSLIKNPFAKFITRASQIAGNVATFGNGHLPVSTGNKAADFAADTLGSVPGAMAAPSLVKGGNVYTGLNKLTSPIEQSVTAKTNGIIGNLAGQSANMGLLSAGDTALHGSNLKDTVKSAAIGAGQGALFGLGAKGVSLLSKGLLPGGNAKFNESLPEYGYNEGTGVKYKEGAESNSLKSHSGLIPPLKRNNISEMPLNNLIPILKQSKSISDMPRIPLNEANKPLESINTIDNINNPSGQNKAAVNQNIGNKYVNSTPINFDIGKNDKGTAKNIRDAFTGKENSQIVRGNQLADTMKKLAPNEQEGIQLYIDAGGDKNYLQSMVNNPDTILDSYIPKTKITYRDAYNQALNLSPNAQKAANMAQQYYKEAGQYALDMGTTHSIRENYANRLWEQEPQGVKTELGRPGISPNTSHSKARVYDTIGEGLLNGKEPATLKANDLLSIHNQELAHANTTRALADSLEQSGLGSYTNGSVPQGFKNVNGLDKMIPTDKGILSRKFVLPEKLSDSLSAITDPDYTKKINWMRNTQKYQGVVKSVDLALSLFHHITLSAQALYNSHGGVDFVKHFNDLNKLDSPEFNKMEQDFASHTGMTTKVGDNYDVLRNIRGQEGTLGKIANLPGVKQAVGVVDKNNDLLFGKIQRWLKVTDYQNKVLDYVSKYPETDNSALDNVKKSIAKEINLAYGGLNWKSMGFNPSTVASMRLGLLAPDWTTSSIGMIGKAFEKGEGGKAARSQYATGVLGGLLLTEGLNHILTGHFTDKNPKGHETEVEVQPGVYISMFRSGIGDATKLASNVITDGLIGGTSRFAQGKLAPFTRTAIGLVTGRDYYGKQFKLPSNSNLKTDFNYVKYAAQSASPIPFGLTGAVKYASSGNATPLGMGLVSTGAGRYSTPPKLNPTDNPAKAYQDNWIYDKITSPQNEREQIDIANKLKEYQAQQTKNSQLARNEVASILKDATGNMTPYYAKARAVMDKYNIPSSQQKSIISEVEDSLNNSNGNYLQRKLSNYSKKTQQDFYNTLAPEQQAIFDKYK